MADKLTQVEHMKYFQEEVTPTLEDLMMVLVVEQPDNPVPAMIRWLVERTKAPTPAAMEQKQLSTLVSSLQADITALEAKLEAARAAAGPPPPEPIVLDTEVAEMAKAAAAVSDAIAEKTPAAGLDAVEAVADAAVDPLVGLPTPKDIAEAAVKAEVDLLAASPEPTIISEPAPSDPVSAVEESLEEGDKEAPEAEEAVAAAAVDAVADAGAPAMDHAEAKPEATTEFQPLPELGAPSGTVAPAASTAPAAPAEVARESAEAPRSLDQPETSSSNLPRGGRRGGRRSQQGRASDPFADDVVTAAASRLEAVAPDESGRPAAKPAEEEPVSKHLSMPEVHVQQVGDVDDRINHLNSMEEMGASESLRDTHKIRSSRGRELAPPSRSREPSPDKPDSKSSKRSGLLGGLSPRKSPRNLAVEQPAGQDFETGSQGTQGASKPRGGRRSFNPFKK
mmetsp:Transcript_70179/g.132373  ORF Transcript_70179/g.132373 Transcript_70179/m.132373 type:complete len:451 (+) Transcript_70179:63-1415(+)